MASLFQKLFNKSASSQPAPPITAAASKLESGDEVQREYEEFCRTFYFRPKMRFMEYLETHKIELLCDWFKPDSLEPEPKTFIRLVNDATRQGIEVWKQTGLDMYLHGNWSNGGGPSPRSREALAALAPILGMTIKVYFTLAEDSEEYQVLEFKP